MTKDAASKTFATEDPDEMPQNAPFAETKKIFRDNFLEMVVFDPSIYKIDCIKFYGKGH